MLDFIDSDVNDFLKYIKMNSTANSFFYWVYIYFKEKTIIHWQSLHIYFSNGKKKYTKIKVLLASIWRFLLEKNIKLYVKCLLLVRNCCYWHISNDDFRLLRSSIFLNWFLTSDKFLLILLNDLLDNINIDNRDILSFFFSNKCFYFTT